MDRRAGAFPMPRQPGRSRLARAALLMSVALLAVALPLELGLRLLPQGIPFDLLTEFEPDIRSAIARRRNLQRSEDTILLPRDDGGPPDRLWTYKPNTDVSQPFREPGNVPAVHTDAHGFCNPPGRDANGGVDIAAVGDSFTWCLSVDPADAWPALLAERTGRRVYNFGLPGRGLHEYLQMLKIFALPRHPRIVVFAVYEGNDLRDAVYFYQWASGEARSRNPCPFDSAGVCGAYERLRRAWPARHSYAFNLIAAAGWQLAYSRHKQQLDFRYPITFADGTTIEFNSRNTDRDELSFAQALARDEIGLGVFDDGLASFVALGRRHGYAPVVIYIPSVYTAYREQARFDDPAIAQVLHAYSDRQRTYFANKASELGYRYVDMTAALAAAARERPAARRLYFSSNLHLTQEGHAVIADALARVLATAPE
jgi:hypothetical protein